MSCQSGRTMRLQRRPSTTCSWRAGRWCGRGSGRIGVLAQKPIDGRGIDVRDLRWFARFSDSLRSRMSSTSLRRALSGWARNPCCQVKSRTWLGTPGRRCRRYKAGRHGSAGFSPPTLSRCGSSRRSIRARSAYEAPSRKSRFPAMNRTLAPARKSLSDSAISSVNGFSSSSPAQYSNRSPRM